METIFVQMVSYRDPECRWTLKDMFEKAAHPERLFAGICWYFDEEQDKAYVEQSYPCPAQVRILACRPSEHRGMGWARMQAQALWRGEDYVLQASSHMRFEQGWDETLIAMLARCDSENSMLSTCLPKYIPPATFPLRDEARASVVKVDKVVPDDLQLLNLVGGLYSRNAPGEGLTRCPFWVGNFFFARARVMQQVPYDPYLFYYGENIAYSARLWTHGWDLFEPDALVLYHYWDNPVIEPQRDRGNEAHGLTFMRIRHLLRMKLATQSAAVFELEQYGLGPARTLDDFWRFAGIDMNAGTCSDAARNGQWNASYAQSAARPAQPVPRPRIFVQIASYRDPECQWTLKDMFEKAAHAERVFAGVCGQYDPEEDKDCFYVATRPAQVRSVLFHWKESMGVCWARNQTQHLWEGEEYTLVIDSHMRFEFGWDERMIAELEQCASPKAVLTCYPAAYVPPHKLETEPKPAVQRANPYSEDGDIRFSGANLDRWPEKPLRGAFIAAGFMFSKSDIIREVPYDPYLYFNQEELSMAARFFTHGWDVYSASNILIYHCYNNIASAKKRRHLHWEDNQQWSTLQERARKRFDHLLGYAMSDDPLVTRDLMKYDLGDERSLADYEAFCGIDFKRRVVSERALRAQFVEHLNDYMNGPIYVPALDDAKEGQQAVPQEVSPPMVHPVQESPQQQAEMQLQKETEAQPL